MNPYESGLDMYQTLPVLLYVYDHVYFWEKIDAKKPWELPFWGIQHVQMLDLRHQKGSPATKAVFRLRSFFVGFKAVPT